MGQYPDQERRAKRAAQLKERFQLVDDEQLALLAADVIRDRLAGNQTMGMPRLLDIYSEAQRRLYERRGGTNG